MIWMTRILLLYYTPVIPLSPITLATCIRMPEYYIARINGIISVHLKYIIQSTIQPALLAIELSNTLKKTAVIRNNTISIRISTRIRRTYCRMTNVTSLTSLPMLAMWERWIRASSTC